MPHKNSEQNTLHQDLVDSLGRLTIVVPTYGRPAEVLKTIKFWRDRGPNLLILDGSPDPLADELLREKTNSLTYIHSGSSTRARLVQSADCIETEYVTLCGDDEVQIPSSLAASVNELDQNPHLVSCLGWALGFSNKVGPRSSNEILGHSCYPALQFRDNTEMNYRDRLVYHFKNYVPSNIYSVVRSDAFRNTLKILNAPGDVVGGQLELEYEIGMVYQGGNRVLPNLHWMRNFGYSDRYTHELDNDPLLPFYECFLDPNWNRWKQEFLLTRSQILSEIDGNAIEDVVDWLEEALLEYSLHIVELKSALPRYKQGIQNLRNQYSIKLSRRHHSMFRAIMQIANRSEYGQSLMTLAETLSVRGMNYSKEELSEILEQRLMP